MNTGEAKKQYNDALKDLEKFCQQAANFDVRIEDEEYPLKIRLQRNEQMTFLEPDAENKEIIISAGLDTVISSGGGINMSAGALKKIINKAEEVGRLYYHSYREEADEEEK